MDEAINNWQIDTDNMDSFIEELSESYSELCMEHIPFAIESLPLFQAKLEYIYHTLA